MGLVYLWSMLYGRRIRLQDDGGCSPGPRLGSPAPPARLVCWRVYCLVIASSSGRAKSGLQVSSRRGKQARKMLGILGQPRGSTSSISNLNPGFCDALGGGTAELRAINTKMKVGVYQGLPRCLGMHPITLPMF